MNTDVLSEVRKRGSVEVDQAISLLNLYSFTENIENQLQILSSVQSRLGQMAVFQVWVEKTFLENNVILRQVMLQNIVQTIELKLDDDFVKALAPFKDKLLEGLEIVEHRGFCLDLLLKLAHLEIELADVISQTYLKLQSKELKNEVLNGLYLLRYQWVNFASFANSILETLADDYFFIDYLAYLLEVDQVSPQTIVKIFQSAHSESAKHTLLTALYDFSSQLNDQIVQTLQTVVQRDPSPIIRQCALCLLGVQNNVNEETLQIFLKVGQSDQDLALRQVAFICLSDRIQKDDNVSIQLLEILKTRTQLDDFEVLFTILRPNLLTQSGIGEKLRLTLLEISMTSSQSNLVRFILTQFVDVCRAYPQFIDQMAKSYKMTNDDATKTVILEIIYFYADRNAAVLELCQQAVKSPATSLKSVGLKALLHLPLTAVYRDLFLNSIGLILDRNLSVEDRNLLALKVSHLPSFSEAESQAVLALSEQLEKPEVKTALIKASQRKQKGESNEAAPLDWAMWQGKIQNEKSSKGLFPKAYVLFEKYPDQVKALCKQILSLTGQDQGGAFEKVENILIFLRGWDLIDDDISRYAIDFLMTKNDQWGSPNFYLALLKSNLSFIDLKESLWKVFERTGQIEKLNMNLMWEVLVLAYGGENQLFNGYLARVEQKQKADELFPYLYFLNKNLNWREAALAAEAIFHKINRQTDLSSGQNAAILKNLVDTFGLAAGASVASAKSDTTSNPGLLDD